MNGQRAGAVNTECLIKTFLYQNVYQCQCVIFCVICILFQTYLLYNVFTPTFFYVLLFTYTMTFSNVSPAFYCEILQMYSKTKVAGKEGVGLGVTPGQIKDLSVFFISCVFTDEDTGDKKR